LITRNRNRRAGDRRPEDDGCRDCDLNLSERLRAGDHLARELGRQLENGSQILSQIAQITLAPAW